MISSVGLFSDNEELEDLGDQEMVFMSVGWVRGEVEGRIGTNGIKARIGVLEKSQVGSIRVTYQLKMVVADENTIHRLPMNRFFICSNHTISLFFRINQAHLRQRTPRIQLREEKRR